MANIITSIRIVCALSLIFFPTFSTPFYIFYIVGGISDILDGITARHLETETKFGARLDTFADIVFTVIVLIKVLQKVYIPCLLTVWIICIAIIKCINIISGFIIYGHFVSEHTVINKICGLLIFAIPPCMGIFSLKSILMLIVTACAAATLAAITEGFYIFKGKEIY